MDKIKLTRGQKNELIRQEWIKRREEVEEKTGKRIILTLKAGPNSSWSFRPGGEGLGFDSPENVVAYLERLP